MDYLPIFVDVRERLIIVIGGGAVAARKVELLLKAHARVRIVAPLLHAELCLFRDAGRIEYVAARFAPEHLEGARLVIAATNDVQVNDAVARSARERGIWANVVDDTERSAFIFPAIVDRSPVIVAIGTEGRSPTLARRVRAQIEALLPERLGELANFAGRWRGRVRASLGNATERLRFWEALFSGPVATQVLSGQPEAAERAAAAELERARVALAAPGPRGEVYLIGAGPGDPDLLTLRAQQLLQLADVILHDRLVSPQILARARRDAQRIYVGKAPGDHRTTQQRINELLVEHAGRGLRVARLKGGDPFIFGRGGEELEVLRQHGIPAVVVPGITAGLGAAASTHLPLTHRGVAQSVTFVTATGAAGELLNWPALAAAHQTVVFYMSAAQTGHIVERMLTAGAAPDLPATIVERATWPEQRVLKATLATLEAVACGAQLQSPSLLVVGEVAALALDGPGAVERFPTTGAGFAA